MTIDSFPASSYHTTLPSNLGPISFLANVSYSKDAATADLDAWIISYLVQVGHRGLSYFL